jgi:hypothetical protein
VGPSGRETVRDFPVIELATPRRARADGPEGGRTKDQAESSYSPIDEEAAPWLVELAERRTWTVEAAAGMNRIAIKAREEED